MGGISSGADAVELLSAGATLVAVGTENFRDPRPVERVADEIARALETVEAPLPSARLNLDWRFR